MFPDKSHIPPENAQYAKGLQPKEEEPGIGVNYSRNGYLKFRGLTKPVLDRDSVIPASNC